MAGRIATISGTMLTPGVSRNKRLYTADLIARAAARMQERLADPNGLPIVMRSHHEAGDDSVRIVGAIRSVKVGEDGRADYTADLYDTTHGRDIASLVAPGKGQPPALRSVSIHGYWLGPVKRIDHEGESVTTAEDLEVDAVDFTASPGVLGATVTAASYLPGGAPATESAAVGGRTAISESAEATVTAISEEAPPVHSKAALRRAIREAANDTARATIMQRAQALGLTALIPSTWKDDGSMAETTRYSDVREYYPDGPSGAAGFCVDAYNGPISITLRACGIDPAELRTVTAAAMAAACDALQAMDPDMDADIDVDGAPRADTDGDSGKPAPKESTGLDQPATVTETEPPAPALTETTPPALGEAATPPKEEPAVSEPTTQETAAPARSLTDADITALGALFGAALKESMAPLHAALTETTAKAKKAEAAETVTPPAADTAKAERKAEKKALKETLAGLKAEFDTKLTEALTAQRSALREELLRENGLPSRQGYRVHESDRAPDNAADLFEDRTNILLGTIGLAPQPAK